MTRQSPVIETYARWVMSKVIYSIYLLIYYSTSKHLDQWDKGYRSGKEHEFHMTQAWGQLLPLVKVKGNKKVSRFPVDIDACLATEISFGCPYLKKIITISV